MAFVFSTFLGHMSGPPVSPAYLLLIFLLHLFGWHQRAQFLDNMPKLVHSNSCEHSELNCVELC